MAPNTRTDHTPRGSRSDRGVSTSIGTLFLVLLGIVLAGVMGTGAFHTIQAVSDPDLPQAHIDIRDADDDFQPTDTESQALVTLHHQSGDRIDTDVIKLVIKTEENKTRVFTWEDGQGTNHVGSGSWTVTHDGNPLGDRDWFDRDDRIRVSYTDDGPPDGTVSDGKRYVITIIHVGSGNPIAESAVDVD